MFPLHFIPLDNCTLSKVIIASFTHRTLTKTTPKVSSCDVSLFQIHYTLYHFHKFLHHSKEPFPISSPRCPIFLMPLSPISSLHCPIFLMPLSPISSLHCPNFLCSLCCQSLSLFFRHPKMNL